MQSLLAQLVVFSQLTNRLPRLVLSCLLILLSGCTSENSSPIIEQGKLELSHWNFSEQGIVELEGDWQYFDNQLLSPDNISNTQLIANKNFRHLPGNWNSDQEQSGKGKGFATFRLVIALPSDIEQPSLRFKNISTAYHLWINGIEYGGRGKVGKTEDTSLPELRHNIIQLSPSLLNKKSNTNQTIEILLQVSNFHLPQGGIIESIELGNLEQLQQQAFVEQTMDNIVTGGLLLMALYYLAHYFLAIIFLKHTDNTEIWYVGVCLLWGLHAFVWGMSGHTILRVWPQMDWELFIRLDYILFYLAIPIMTRFLSELFPNESSTLITRIWMTLGVLFSLQTLFFSSSYYSQFIFYYELLAFPQLVYIYWFLIRAVNNKREGAVAVLMGMTFFFFIAVLALLNDMGIIVSSLTYTPLGVWVLILTQAYALSIRTAFAFVRVEELSNKLEEKNLALEKSDKVKDEFLANTSHELRTPLNGIIGLADSLHFTNQHEFNEQQKNELLLISNSGKRLANLVNDLLDFSQLKNKDLKLKASHVNLASLISSVVTICTPLIGEKSIEIINNVDSKLPFVSADEDRLQQVFYNLIGNAIKFTDNGSITISADIVNNNKVKISIKDTGRGISESNLENIFNPFEQVDGTSTRETEGVGLGLSISRQLVELLGGQLQVESQKSQGSEFYFSLPINLDDSKVVTTTKSQLKRFPLVEGKVMSYEAKNFVNSKGQHVLVVDDDTVNLQVAYNHLSEEGFAVTTANGGNEALELIEKGKQFDLVLLDIMMPDMNGFEVCRRIRHRHSAIQLPVIIVTAKNRLEDLVQGLNIGANDYLTKPYSREELLARTFAQIKVRAAHFALRENAVLKQELLMKQQSNSGSSEEVVLDEAVKDDSSVDGNPTDNNSQENMQRTQLVEIMNQALDLWVNYTSTTKIELAHQSQLWKVYMDSDGWERTQTLDRYLQLETLPKRPRKAQVIRTVKYIIDHCSDDLNRCEPLNMKLKSLYL